MLHILLHLLIPLIISLLFFRKSWKKAYVVMVLTMLVDLDHLLATPIYDATRCSIGFHPLHTFIPICIYLIACFIPKVRYIGVGLIIHMILDSIDCQLTNGIWFS